MSGTRSRSPKAPATEALIVAHGQPSEPEPPEAETAALAARVAALLPGWRLQGATLAMPGALDDALAATAAPPLIYPLFMADGWFVASELPRRLGERSLSICAPLGLDPALPSLAAAEISARAVARGWPLSEVTMVIAAHGSGRSGNAARATRDFAEAMRSLLPLAGLRVGFVEQAPSIAAAAVGLGSRAICLPFFAARRGHVIDDVPAALAEARFSGELAEPVGTLPGVPGMIAASFRAAAARLPVRPRTG